MRVIKPNSTEWPKRCNCDNCNALLEYDQEDVFYGEMGMEYVECPECGCDTCVSSERNLAPLFPVTFFKSNRYDNNPNVQTIQKIVDGILKDTCDEWEEDAEIQDCLPHWISDNNAFVLAAQDNDGVSIVVCTGDIYEDCISYQDLKKFYK